MKFLISKNESGWNITPTTGRFQDEVVAKCEAVCLQGVQFAGKAMIGRIRALWGTRVVQEGVYADQYTLNGLNLTGVFNDGEGGSLMEADYDGYNDPSDKLCKFARRVLAVGDNVYAKGAV
jgi:hypothetical protein